MAERDPELEALREAIERFGRIGAAEVVAEAQAEAIARARSALADAMTRSLLEHARLDEGSARAVELTERTPEPPQPTPAVEQRDPESVESVEPRQAEPHEEEQGEACYVYGVISGSGQAPAPESEGVAAGNPPYAIQHGALAAVASRVPLPEFGEERLRENLNDVDWLERTARAHESVLEAALAATTVVPLRLCTIYRSEEQVREMLDREGEVFEEALARLEGRAEWGVKLIAEPGALERAAGTGEPGADATGETSPGAAYMHEKRRRAEAQEQAELTGEAWADLVHGRAAALATEALLNPIQNPEVSGHTGDMLLNGVYLVDNDVRDEFAKQIADLGAEFAELGVSVELTGPWPAYNFIKGSIEAAR